MEKKQKNSQQDEKKVKKQPVKKQKQTEEKPVEKKFAVKTKQEVKTTEEKTKPEVKTEKSQPTKTEMPKKKKSGLFKAAMATFAVAAAVALSIFGITELTKVSPEKAVSEITQNGEIRYGKVNELVLSFDKNVSFDKDGDVVWILDGSEVQRGSVKNGDSFVLKHELGSVGLHDVREDLLLRLFAYKRTALRAILCPEFDIEQTKEMLDFRDRRNCRLAAAAACTLLDCHRRCNARDAFDVGLRRRLCDGTCVGVETFQITSLSFGKNDAEGKRRFS